ncbi:hypothetical protein Ga0100231_010045 [Opitutaceae bacterium TAV4]|nr:hypothetical protein Ga0100231_010045 [Opitutaceae bacterium TAV4]
MNLQDRLLTHLRTPHYQPVNEARLALELGIDRKQRGQLRHALRGLLSHGDLRLVSGDKIALPATTPSSSNSGHPRSSGGPGIITGRIQFRAGGSAVVIPQVNPGATAADSEPIQISYDDTGTALHGDTVEVRITPSRPARAARPTRSQRNPAAARRDSRNTRDASRANERRGRVVNILERGSDIMIGTLRRIRSSWYVQPDDPRFQHEVSVPDPALTLRPPTPPPPPLLQKAKAKPKPPPAKPALSSNPPRATLPPLDVGCSTLDVGRSREAPPPPPPLLLPNPRRRRQSCRKTPRVEKPPRHHRRRNHRTPRQNL